MSESEEKKKVHPLQRAWAAGVFEAKVYFPKSGYVLRFESVDDTLMKRFHETVGVGNLHIAEKKNCSRPVYIFQTESMDASRDLLLLVAPFLSSHRALQASDLIAKVERNPNWQRKHPEKAKDTVIVKTAGS